MSAGLFALMSKKGREEKRLKELRDAFDAADKDKVSTKLIFMIIVPKCLTVSNQKL